MGDAKAADLAKAENLLVVVSTWGEGDPPDAATGYYEEFMGKSMPQLANLKFSVCGLGDTSYEQFCKMGKDFDARLSELGAERIFDRADCDVDYQEPFEKWLDGAINAFPKQEDVASAIAATGAAPASEGAGGGCVCVCVCVGGGGRACVCVGASVRVCVCVCVFAVGG